LYRTHAIKSQPPLAWNVSGGMPSLILLRMLARASALPSTLESTIFTRGFRCLNRSSSAPIACASPPCFHQSRISIDPVSPPSEQAGAETASAATTHSPPNKLRLDLISVPNRRPR
jgi:hypothetical protein